MSPSPIIENISLNRVVGSCSPTQREKTERGESSPWSHRLTGQHAGLFICKEAKSWAARGRERAHFVWRPLAPWQPHPSAGIFLGKCLGLIASVPPPGMHFNYSCQEAHVTPWLPMNSQWFDGLRAMFHSPFDITMTWKCFRHEDVHRGVTFNGKNWKQPNCPVTRGMGN